MMSVAAGIATTGRLVSALWQKRYGTKVDGVLSIDPVALGYILKATGPVDVAGGVQLTSDNAVQILLSETYAQLNDPAQQDAFFTAAATAVFSKVASGQFDKATMLSALAQAGDDRRVFVWSAHEKEQSVLAGTTLAGALPTSSSSDRGFGVYLNDGTGAKMDYYLHTTVGLGSAQCRSDHRGNYVVQVTLTSDAPKDAATSLPWYVTGAGLNGVPAGETDTTVAVYAPQGFVSVGATSEGENVPIQRGIDGGMTVAHVLMKLKPGQSVTYAFQFVGTAVTSATALSAETTPGVWPTDVKQIDFACSDVVNWHVVD